MIQGGSARGGSVAFHLTVDGGRDDKLFVGAIFESRFLPTHRSVAQSEFQYNRFVEGVGCSSHGDTLACLRSKDTSILQGADVASHFPWRFSICYAQLLLLASSVRHFLSRLPIQPVGTRPGRESTRNCGRWYGRSGGLLSELHVGR